MGDSSGDLQNDVVITEFATSRPFSLDILPPPPSINSPAPNPTLTYPISSPDFQPPLQSQNDDVFLFNSRVNQVSFVMDLIHQRIEHPDVLVPPDQSHLHLDLHNNYNQVLDWDTEFTPEFNESGVDFDEDDQEYRIVRGDDNDSDDLMLPLWDSLLLDERRNNEGFNWEEIAGMVNEGEDDAFVPVLSQEEEERGEGGEELDVDWEVLMNMELDFQGVIRREFSLGDQIVGEDVGRGKPPASEKEVERLGIVVVSEGDLEMGNVVCAVCKDDISVGEEVREMPCGHRYHGDCIMPWLRIRNTCPVCRFELPTDDTDYERTRAQRVGPAN